MSSAISLNHLEIGNTASVYSLTGEKEINRRLIDIGFIKGEKITCLGESPFKSPKAFFINGAIIALRDKDSKFVTVIKEGENHCE